MLVAYVNSSTCATGSKPRYRQTLQNEATELKKYVKNMVVEWLWTSPQAQGEQEVWTGGSTAVGSPVNNADHECLCEAVQVRGEVAGELQSEGMGMGPQGSCVGSGGLVEMGAWRTTPVCVLLCSFLCQISRQHPSFWWVTLLSQSPGQQIGLGVWKHPFGLIFLATFLTCATQRQCYRLSFVP